MTTDTDVTAALERLDRALEHPRALAQQAIVAHYSPREQRPWINRHDDKGAPTLDRDAVLRRSEPQHAPKLDIKQRRSRLRFWR